MSITLSQSDYHSIFQESEQKVVNPHRFAHDESEEKNTIYCFPKRLGHGYYQEGALRLVEAPA